MGKQSGDVAATDTEPSAPGAVPVRWAVGTAYDFFASLFVIHHAETTGLRRAWAAGVRNRLAAHHRELLQRIVPIVSVPVEWLQTLGEYPDANAILRALCDLPDGDILPALADHDFMQSVVICRVMREKAFSQREVDEFLSEEFSTGLKPATSEAARGLLAVFSDPAGSGALLRTALIEYHRQFFEEEERRISGYLTTALERAQARARECSLVDLVDELSGGLRLENAADAAGLLLIPSFWAGPLVLFEMLPDDTWVILFSARPRDVTIIPGDPVPDTLTRSLQAVSDQTRLRILKLLTSAPRTQIQIARELRLRPPTITHHLKILRLANLVRLTESATGEKRYDVREARLREVGQDLTAFVSGG
jgi:DNA-binding transcriptional ArsR family regulator